MANVYSGATAGAGAAVVGGETAIVGVAENVGGPGPTVISAGTLTGDDVVNRLGEDLGTIKEIMLDVPSGKVAYAVISSGGLLGIGDKLFAIPWSALTLDVDRKCFILDVDAERFKEAPGFDKDHWPSMADLNWATELHAWYGQSNYWHPDNI